MSPRREVSLRACVPLVPAGSLAPTLPLSTTLPRLWPCPGARVCLGECAYADALPCWVAQGRHNSD